jgi:divalent metal cation (Fe/Co/Zn/Cd) transporter
MDASLPDDEVERIDRVIAAHLPKHAGYHALRTRKAGSRRFIEFHLEVPGATAVRDAHRLCDRLEAALEEALANAQVLIHVEPRETDGQAPRPRTVLRAHE